MSRLLITFRYVVIVFSVAAGLSFSATEASSNEDRGVVANSAFSGKFALNDHDGKPVTDQSWPGKFKLVFFGFTHCPDVCPTTLDKLTLVLEKLNTDASKMKTLFITTDPARDTPEVMKRYVEGYGHSITGLTGTEAQVQTAIDSFKVYASKVPAADGSYAVNHSSFIFLLSPRNEVLAIYSNSEPVNSLVQKIRPHLAEESPFGK
jgi:protein SCO1/2